jgi:hypothetical protein
VVTGTGEWRWCSLEQVVFSERKDWQRKGGYILKWFCQAVFFITSNKTEN